MAYTDADNDVRGILIDFDLAAPIRTSLRLPTPNRPTIRLVVIFTASSSANIASGHAPVHGA